MAEIDVNGVRTHYELAGDGDGMVLVHGSWDDLHAFDGVAPALAQRYRVLAYDRRGHSGSTGEGTIDDDVADLAALIESLDLAPAHVVGHSLGGSVALRFAIARPDLLRTVNVHEPPLFALLADDPEGRAQLEEAAGRIEEVVAEIEAGNPETAARRFVDEVALGPGAWETLPPKVHDTMIGNAATFAEEVRDRRCTGSTSRPSPSLASRCCSPRATGAPRCSER
ncbi:MAG: alpha/beta fold hydrolase [Solirubrobacterales bacterium]